jgi:hypothetical protein
MDIIQDFTFDTKFNQTRHEFEIYLDNGAGDSDNRKYPINPNSIVNLTIEDTLADWVVKGHMTFYYNPESLQGPYDDRTGNRADAVTSLPSIKQSNPYIFRNDGNDLLRIRIIPILSNESNLDGTTSSENIAITDKKHWTLSYLFSVYEIEDIDLPPGARNQASSIMKCLKIYFWDSWYQKMITNYLEYSTGLSYFANTSPPQPDLYSNPNVIPTGLAIKEIIDLSLTKTPSQSNYNGSASGLIDPSLNVLYNPTAELGENWNSGASKIFFTSSPQNNSYENLMYVLEKHVSSSTGENSSVYDFDILIKNRGPTPTDVGQLTLKSMSSYFAKAGNSENAPGEYQIEHFFLQSYGSDNIGKKLKAPLNKKLDDKVDLKSEKYNQITSYRFVDISALTNSTLFCNTPVHSFDFKNRTFNIEYKNNTVLTARKFMSENYINKLYKSGQDNEKLFLITLDEDKKNKNIVPRFSCNGDEIESAIRQSEGIKRLLYIGVFQNACVNFRVLGLTNREPGRFIGIDKVEGSHTGPFEDKFFGQWFIINIKHVFETEFYYNDITAIKIHRFAPLPLRFTGTLDNS